jgi:hypothetical protein
MDEARRFQPSRARTADGSVGRGRPGRRVVGGSGNGLTCFLGGDRRNRRIGDFAFGRRGHAGRESKKQRHVTLLKKEKSRVVFLGPGEDGSVGVEVFEQRRRQVRREETSWKLTERDRFRRDASSSLKIPFIFLRPI